MIDKDAFASLQARANDWLRKGDFEAAESAFTRLADHYPEQPAGLAGLAQLAQIGGDWQRSLECWDACLALFPAGSPVDMRIARAQSVFMLGRVDEAYEIVAGALLETDRSQPVAVSLLWAATERLKNFAEALACLEALERLYPDSLNALMLRARYSSYCHEPNAANRAVAVLLGRQLTLPDLQSLFEVVVRTLDEAHLNAVLLRLLEMTRGLMGKEAGSDNEPLDLFAARLCLAMNMPERAGEALSRVKRESGSPLFSAMALMLGRMRDPAFPDYTAPKIFCIGLSKTGTSSLNDALNLLGFSAVHWLNPVTRRLIGKADFFLFDAFSDTSVCYNFEYLYYAFPNAKFIYTERPVEGWSRSFIKHFRELGATYEEMQANVQRLKRKKYGWEWDMAHRALYFNHPSPAEAYAAFDRRVRQFFSDKPPECFLNLNIFQDEGWDKLCGFLGRPVPAEPFPHSNKTA